MNTHHSNPLPVRPALLAASLCWLSLGASELVAQQYQYPPGYAPPRYTQPQGGYQNQAKPGVTDRIKSTGQNIGNFIKRSFYGESSQPVQQPTYQTSSRAQYRAPAGSTPSRGQGRYSLDAPPRKAPATTGFQAPRSKDVPKYTPAPVSKPTKSVTKKSTETNRAPTSSSTKRYTPSKPSSFSKPAPKKVEDSPPSVPYEPTVPQTPTYPTEPAPTMPQRELIESEPAPTIEAKAKDTQYPLPGGISTPVSDTPPSTSVVERKPVETPSTTSSSSTGSSANSFMIGKKTSKPGRVVSPYAPYNELDITGLPSGSLALDPTTQKVFQVP